MKTAPQTQGALTHAAFGLLVATSAFLAGCGQIRPRIDRVVYRQWTEAYRLSNGTVEVVVVPAIARIMHYGFVGGENVLWEDPSIAGQKSEPDRWSNFGGDKVWIWPESAWAENTGRAWPPPPGTEGPLRAKIVHGNILRVTSPVIEGYGIRIVRDMELACYGTRLTVTSRFEKVERRPTPPISVWTVTQLPAMDPIFAGEMPDPPVGDGFKLFSATPWKSIRRTQDNVLIIERPRDKNAKLGTDARLLALTNGSGRVLFVQILKRNDGDPRLMAPAERAQVYSTSDKPPNLPSPFVELEFASFPRLLSIGDSVSMTVTWELFRIEASTPAEVAATLKQLGERRP